MTSSAAAPIKPVKERIATLGVFLANGFGIGAWAVEVPRIKESLALGDASLGIALFAFALGAIVAMPLAGQLAPRFGSGRHPDAPTIPARGFARKSPARLSSRLTISVYVFSCK